MKVIGITGGIATGKSLVATYLRQNHYQVVCADELVAKILEKDENCFYKIAHFFPSVVTNNQDIDKKKLAKIIFNNKEQRNILNNIIHPIVRENIILKIEKAKEIQCNLFFIVVPLLFETNFDQLCDIIITVYCEQEIQIRRLMERDNIDREYALNKINAQMNIEEKIKLSDYVINNSSDNIETIKQIENILEEVKLNGL